jgi:hypothetical protein
MRRRVLLPLLALALIAVPATPAAAAFGPAFDPTLQTNGEVLATAVSGDRVFLGGHFTRAGVPTPNGLDLR